jgi:hypothetical protein
MMRAFNNSQQEARQCTASIALPTSRLSFMQEQSTPWMVLSIENILKHGSFTDSWIGQQEQVTWTHHLIFAELCMPEKLPGS